MGCLLSVRFKKCNKRCVTLHRRKRVQLTSGCLWHYFPLLLHVSVNFPIFFLQLASSFRETTYFARCPLFRFGWFCGSVWAGVLPAPSPSPGSQEEEMREPSLRTPGSLPRPPGPQAGCRVYGLAHSPPRPTASTWRKFFRVKSHKFLFP